LAARPESQNGRNLLRLVYVSVAAPGLTAADLAAIAACSAERNRKAGLTGLLLYRGESFVGVLEGRSRVLFARMERIATDPRHARLDIRFEAPVADRRFETWSFGEVPAPVASRPADDFVRTLCR
jgi:hypothetical protein